VSASPLIPGITDREGDLEAVAAAVKEAGAEWFFSGVLFLMPICVILVYFTWPFFLDAWRINERSSNAGGLISWPVKLLLPVGFALMALQGLSEIIKRIAALAASYRLEYRYEKPVQ